MKVVLSALVVASLTGCATHSPDVIHPYEAQRMSYLSDATVLSVRPVTIDGYQSGVGAGVGAIAGGVAAANAASYYNSAGPASLGAVVGGVIGNADGAQRDAAERRRAAAADAQRRAALDRPGQRQRRLGDRRAGRARHHRRPDPGDPGAAAVAAVRSRCRRRYPAPETMPAPVPVYPQSGPVPPRS